jgi:hypothetical protein
MKSDETLPEIGEYIDVWFQGHIAVEIVAHNDDNSLDVRLPGDDEVVVAENVSGNWEVNSD